MPRVNLRVFAIQILGRLRSAWVWIRTRRSNRVTDPVTDDRRLVFGLSRSRIPSGRQFRFLFDIMNRRERLAVQWMTLIAVIAGFVLLGNFLAQRIEAVPRSGGTLVEGLLGVPEYINPVLARPNTVEAELTGLTFRGLMQMDKDFQLTPDLAEKIDVSPDGKEYTITLKPNLRWSDGSRLTARDVEFTFTTLSDPAYKSPLLSIFQNVTVKQDSDRVVKFSLKEPLAPFLSYLTIGLLPENAWIDTSPAAFPLSELNLRPIGNGPYAFHSLTKDREGNIKSLRFVRNEYFNGPKPYIDQVVTKLYPSHAAATEALQTHAIDALGNIDQSDLDHLSTGRTITTFDISRLTSVFLNQRSNGALRALEVRKALSHATNRELIINRALNGYGVPVIGPILPGYLGYNPHLLRYDYNLDTARQILEDSGWKLTESGIRQKGEQQLTLTFHVADVPTQVAVANALVETWEQIGANVELKIVEAARIQRDVIRPRSYEALLYGQMFNTDPDQYPFWHSSQQKELGFNLSIFFNRKMDEDLEHGRRTTSNEERAVDYFDFQNILKEELPAIFLYQNQSIYLHPRNLRGIETKRIVSGINRFDHIETWYLRTWPKWVGPDRSGSD